MLTLQISTTLYFIEMKIIRFGTPVGLLGLTEHADSYYCVISIALPCLLTPYSHRGFTSFTSVAVRLFHAHLCILLKPRCLHSLLVRARPLWTKIKVHLSSLEKLRKQRSSRTLRFTKVNRFSNSL